MDEEKRRALAIAMLQNPMAGYAGDEAAKSGNAATAYVLGGSAALGAGLGAAPATGPVGPLASLPPAVMAFYRAYMEEQRRKQMQSGADMWSQTGMPGSPHDPGVVPGGGAKNY